MPRITLFKKILFVTLLLSLLPMLVTSLILLSSLESVNQRLTAEITGSSDAQASQNLQMRAQHVAETIADFLRQRESDLFFLAQTPLDRNTVLNFYNTRRGEIWERRGTIQSPRETRELVPLYRSIAVIDSSGRETMVIRNGRFLPPAGLRDVSRPEQTEFRSEDYFQRIKGLKKGELHVTHLTGFHLSKQEQLAGASEPEFAVNGASYQGVIRFGTPLFSPEGRFRGMVVISLDHRHLMEFTQHIDPGLNFSTIFPSYKSGNYAFLFDDEGWIITHPKYWDIRGVDKDGKIVPAYSKNSSRQEIESGRIPFNLDQAGFIHSNYPLVASEVRKNRNGFVDITNVGGAKKIMAYAPIPYDAGDYSRFGIFGGVTIGFQVDQFHDAAGKGSRLINRELHDHRTWSMLIILATALLAGASAWVLSRGITSPINQLTAGARRLAKGDASSPVHVSSSDELGELAGTFNFMANELELRKASLLKTLDELRRSRMEILEERNFKESILESISSAIATFSQEGLLTSINGTGRMFLGNDIRQGMHFSEVFREWADMPQKIEQALLWRTGYGRQPLRLDRGNGMTYFETGLFPIGKDAENGLTVTIRNETEKEKLREEMTRLERLASLGKLSAGIAHEVRNPLTGISLLLDDLHDRAALAADDQEMLKKALSEIERVERLVSALLSYSAPARVEFRTSDLNQVVRDVAMLLGKQCERQGISVQLETADIPLFRFDPEKIKQALINLMKNALEAMPGGGRIRFVTEVKAGFASITFSDNGSGIKKEDLPLIFEPFFTRKGAGTGLGLSITQRIMDEHHGRIRVESNAGSGTTFILELPLDLNS